MRVLFIGGPIHAQILTLARPLPKTYEVRTPLFDPLAADVPPERPVRRTRYRLSEGNFGRRPQKVYVTDEWRADLDRLARLWSGPEVDE
jgi:hypothetical protein